MIISLSAREQIRYYFVSRAVTQNQRCARNRNGGDRNSPFTAKILYRKRGFFFSIFFIL